MPKGSGQRERAKAARRTLIIDVAERLIRERQSTDFSMRELGKEAGLSPFTTYNLIGTKSAVIYALLNRSLDAIGDTRTVLSTASIHDQIYQAGDAAVDIFTGDPNFYKPLLRMVLGVPDPLYRPAFTIRAYDYWRSVMRCLDPIELTTVTAIDLAHDVQVFFNGALEIWVHDDTDEAQFRAQIRHGLTLRMLALGLPDPNGRLAATLAQLRPTITEVVNHPKGG